MLKGRLEGSSEGSPEGTLEGSPEGTLEGILEGRLEGRLEGTLEGSPEGTLEGILEGSPEGTLEGTLEGSPEGTLEGSPEGTLVGKGLLKGIYRWTGTLYHVPSLRYLLESSDASQDQVDAVNSYFATLRVGDLITWDVATEEPVFYTQDRNGNDLPEPRKSTRLYADIDLEKLESAVAGASAPAPKPKKAKA
jgi:hypothetical protein